MSQTPARKNRRALAAIARRMNEELKKPAPKRAKLTKLFRTAQELGVKGGFE